MPFEVSAPGAGVSRQEAAACLGLGVEDVLSEGRVTSLGGNP